MDKTTSKKCGIIVTTIVVIIAAVAVALLAWGSMKHAVDSIPTSSRGPAPTVIEDNRNSKSESTTDENPDNKPTASKTYSSEEIAEAYGFESIEFYAPDVDSISTARDVSMMALGHNEDGSEVIQVSSTDGELVVRSLNDGRLLAPEA